METTYTKKAQKQRKTNYPINNVILGRWSPRALSGEKISDEELFSLFEAARWAPSSYNNQPWRFLYAKQNSKHWDKFFNLMVEFNQGWAKNAAVLVVAISKKNFEHNEKPSRTHSFDTGAAWQNLALEASSRGIVAHGMEGFDYEKTRVSLNIPEGYNVEMMIAIGREGKKDDLPEDLQKNEVPSQRKPLKDIVFEGHFRL